MPKIDQRNKFTEEKELEIKGKKIIKYINYIIIKNYPTKNLMILMMIQMIKKVKEIYFNLLHNNIKSKVKFNI